MVDELLLLSGNDIPFVGGRAVIHPPTIKEIGYIGEKEFHVGSRFLIFDKETLDEKDKSDLENKSNFDIFMSVMNSKQNAMHKTDALMVLTLIFPNIKFKIEQDKILLQQENIDVGANINALNFEEFQDIIRQMFCIGKMENEQEYNPEDGLAKKIAEKLKKRQKKLAKQQGQEEQKINLFSRYASILAVGLGIDLNIIMNYTVYQLFDEMKRFKMKLEYDLNIQARLAGATDLEEVKHWMEDIHS